jgi:hypothetical protein
MMDDVLPVAATAEATDADDAPPREDRQLVPPLPREGG